MKKLIEIFIKLYKEEYKFKKSKRNTDKLKKKTLYRYVRNFDLNHVGFVENIYEVNNIIYIDLCINDFILKNYNIKEKLEYNSFIQKYKFTNIFYYAYVILIYEKRRKLIRYIEGISKHDN